MRYNKVLIVYNSNVHLTVLIAIQPTAGCQSRQNQNHTVLGFLYNYNFLKQMFTRVTQNLKTKYQSRMRSNNSRCEVTVYLKPFFNHNLN